MYLDIWVPTIMILASPEYIIVLKFFLLVRSLYNLIEFEQYVSENNFIPN